MDEQWSAATGKPALSPLLGPDGHEGEIPKSFAPLPTAATDDGVHHANDLVV